MDSLSQLALGAAVGVAVMGRRTALWKAALWGGVCGTLPDLDTFLSHGDAIRDMTFHRAESHALFWLSLVAPLLAWLVARLHGEQHQWRRWGLAVWLALVTHPLLDTMTVYGTQLALPFSDHPYGVGSIFIIDPLYTVPLLVGLAVALTRRQARGLRWNTAGLLLSSAYLGWSVVAQQHVATVARHSLAAEGVTVERLLVTPTPFNTVLWRVVAVTPEGYREGFRSLLDRSPRIAFEPHPRGEALYEQLRGQWHVERMAWFTQGLFKVERRGDHWRLTDLRMGQEPFYTFSFDVAEATPGGPQPIVPRPAGRRPPTGPALDWLLGRMLDETLRPPR
jgi:inner membrane protein